MPQLDKTGPQGLGPRTGRGLGNCPASKDSKSQSPATGSGFGMRNRAPKGTPGGKGLGMRNRAPQGTNARRGL